MVRAGALQGFGDVVLALGGDPSGILTQHGVGPIDDPERLISLDAAAEMFEHCAAALNAPDFGLRVGLRQGPLVLGAAAAAARPGRTIAQVIADVSRFLFLHSPAYDVSLDASSPISGGGETLRFTVDLEDATPARQFIDGCLASAHRALDALTSGASGLQGVSLPHSPVASPHPYRAAFESHVFFEQPYAGLHFAAGSTDRVVRDLSALQELLAAKPLAGVDGRTKTTADRVRDQLRGTLGSGVQQRAEVAASLGLHPRTLQRRLADEGTTFEQVKDEAHRALALRLLQETSLPGGQVAAILGYSEQAAFTRACKRWFGQTPTQVRATAARR